MNAPYIKSEADGVWQRHAHQAFGYSDGDETENRIAALISEASDCSVFSDELHGHIRDWPSMYHLSSLRANLMRPLEPLLQGSVLEIGSGCGAITRYLGETAQSVLALEGSRRRAHITRMRTRDLDHVQVYCDEFSAFSTQSSFDAVTLIGVLEYAHLFVQGEHPALQMLSKARERLKRDGCLIIAIENQLGLKYFAGAPEDHLGQAMVGIENRYEAGGVRTYGKQALTELVRMAGFESLEFFYPFPDYKLPVSVLSQRAFEHPRFDASAFLALSAGKDPQLAGVPGFSMERVWPVLCANSLAPQLANSFLIVARPHQRASASAHLAWHYGTRRKPEYSKETTFLTQEGNDGIEIVRRRLAPSGDGSGPDPIRQVLEDHVIYEPLPLLSEQLIDTVTRPGWTNEQLAAFVLRYARCLTKISGTPLTEQGHILWHQCIAGDYYDCIPQNIRLHPDGSCSAFDLEWRLSEELPLVRLVLRSLWHTLGGLSLIGIPKDGGTPSVLDVAVRALNANGYELGREEAQDLVRAELDLQRQITGTEAQYQHVWNWLDKGSLRYHSLSGKVAELESHSQNLLLLLDQHQRHSSELSHLLTDHQQHSSNLSQELGNRDSTLSAFQMQIAELQQELVLVTGERSECRHLLQAQADELDKSAQTLGRINRDTRLHILARSPMNSIRLLQDYHRSLPLTRRQPSDPSLELTWRSRIGVFLSARPMTTFLARVELKDQAPFLLRQSCRWTIPFEWCFITPNDEIGQVALTASARLDVPARILRAPLGESSVLPENQYPRESARLLATPCFVGTGRIDSMMTVASPDPEKIRLAYVALVCNPRLACVVVNAIPAPDTDSCETTAVLTMWRSGFTPSSHSFMTMNGNGTQEDLATEIERLRNAAACEGQHILLM